MIVTTNTTTDGTSATDRWHRRLWTYPVLRPLALFVASRALVLTASAAGSVVAGTAGRDVMSGPWPHVPSTGSSAFDGLLRWDSAWYITVAQDGYSDEATDARNAFFPLFPALVRAFALLPGVDTTVAALAVVTAAGAAATVLVWWLGRRISGDAAADRMAALFAFFPGSIALSMAYSEALLIGLAAACLVALHDRRWFMAGLLAAAATASRPTAVALCVACAWAALSAIRREGDWRALVAPALAPAGALTFFLFLWSRTGEPLAWFTAQRVGWGERVDFNVAAARILTALRDPVGEAGEARDINTLVPAIGTVIVVVALVVLARWRPPSPVVVYAVLTISLALLSVTIGPRPRMIFAAFPLIMAVAAVLRGPVFAGVLATSAGALGILTVLTVGTSSVTP